MIDSADPRLPAAGVLALLSLGLPWGLGPGVAHPARVAVVAAVVLVLAGLRTGRERLLLAAAVVGGAGVLLGGVDASAGRLALAAAVGCLLLARRWRWRSHS